MSQIFFILGAGMQGTAAAYDLAKFADPAKVVLADLSLEQAIKSAARVNHLTGKTVCEPTSLNVLNPDELRALLKPGAVVLSCVPYWMHCQLAPTVIESGCSMCDLGGATDITLATIELNEKAKQAGVTLIPDCGLAPGLVNSLALYIVENLPNVVGVKLFCGVLPQHPKPPFNYKLTFNVEGLVAEYDHNAVILRNGEIVEVETLTELEEVDFGPLGKLEAFTTSGGSSTTPYTLQGRLEDYEYKTLRYPGHCERMRIFKDFGFWDEQPVEVKGVPVVPKDVFNKVFGRSLAKIQDVDHCVIRAFGQASDGRTLTLDIYDKHDESTGFSAMERLTGFSLAIYARNVSLGKAPTGCVRYEDGMTGTDFVSQLRERGIEIKETTG